MTGWAVIDAFVRAHGLASRPRSVGQTVAGSHVAGSKHYLGLAVDYGRADSESDAIAQLLKPFATGPNAPLSELFGSDGTSLKDGVALSPEPAGHAGNHTHAAIRAGVTTLDGYAPAPDLSTGAGLKMATATGSGLDSLGTPSTAIRIIEIVVGSVLILMGFVALSNALKGGAAWPK